jgi:hypothetical protein
MMGGQKLQISVPEGFPWYMQQNKAKHCSAIKEHCDNLPLYLLQIADISLFLSMSQYLTLVTMISLSS